MAAKRRPNVPRTVRPQRTTGSSRVISGPETAEHKVIRADFAGHAPAKAAPTMPVQGASAKPASAKPAPETTAPGAPAKPAPAKPASAKPAPARKTAAPRNAEFRIRERVRLAGSIKRGKAAPPPEPVVSPENGPVPARTFSGRLLALAVVLITITVMLAPSVRIYFQQQAEIAALQEDIAEKKDQGKEVQGQLDRWQDPAYVKAQARERLFLVMPGETRYLVKGADGFSKSEEVAVGNAPEDLAWVDALWNSVQRSATAR